ncbi:MAG: cation diffusion facilitator family transporter, partial [Rhodospirillales bacterium]|nr:cation diffusion facilitator family transporter [Rhodospirillales bacterium]
GLTAMKLVVGIMTGSIGVLSEAAHSALDVVATIITWLAVRVSDKPADREHPYGHQKMESVAALVETALLFLTSAWILWAAGARLLAPGAHPVEATWYAAAVMVVSIVVDFFRSRSLYKIARETKSHALEADALHFKSDIYSSAAVLVGVGAVWAGWPQGDAVAAIAVAVVVLRAGWRLGSETVGALVDAAPEGAIDGIRAAAAAVPGVVDVRRVRARPAGPTLFVDIEVLVSRTLGIERTAEIKEAVADAVHASHEDADVMVYAEPLRLDDETVHQRVHAIAVRLGTAVHHVTVQQLGKRASVSLDLEVDARLTIGEAHEVASRLEKALHDELDEAVEIETHIEPRAIEPVDAAPLRPDELERLQAIVIEVAQAVPTVLDAHDIRGRYTERGVYLSFHCHFSPSENIETVHEAVSRVENDLRERIPHLRRAIIHAEPKN